MNLKFALLAGALTVLSAANAQASDYSHANHSHHYQRDWQNAYSSYQQYSKLNWNRRRHWNTYYDYLMPQVLPNHQKNNPWFVDGKNNVDKKNFHSPTKAKNVILFVGDGMGFLP